MVLVVALFPLLGIGGMQLYKAETLGSSKDEKITPRIAQTAKALWIIYVALTLACAAAYWQAGMSVFDAGAHALTTMSTGGFSPYDASMAHFDSYTIETITVVFMFAASVNYTVHYLGWRGRSLNAYATDPQVVAFAVVRATFVAIGTVYLLVAGGRDEGDPMAARRAAGRAGNPAVDAPARRTRGETRGAESFRRRCWPP